MCIPSLSRKGGDVDSVAEGTQEPDPAANPRGDARRRATDKFGRLGDDSVGRDRPDLVTSELSKQEVIVISAPELGRCGRGREERDVARGSNSRDSGSEGAANPDVTIRAVGNRAR